MNTAAIAVSLTLSLGASTVRAGSGLPDPMRPSGVGSAGANGHGGPASQAAGGELRLQSVLLGRRGAQTAVINGTLVALGGRIGDARLVRLTERSAVLAGPQGSVTLPLISTVERQTVASGASSPALPTTSKPTEVPTP